MVKVAQATPDDLADISDVQLIKRLKEEYNYVCGPILDTTRNLYIKKLKDFIEKDTNAKTTGKQSKPNSRTNSPVRTATPKTNRRKTIATPLTINQDSPKPTTRRASVGRSPGRKAKAMEEVKSAIAFSDTETEDNLPNDKPSTSVNQSITDAAALEYSRGSRLLKKSFNNRISTVNKQPSTTAKEKPSPRKSTATPPRSDSFSSDDSVKRTGGVGFSTKATKSNSTPLSTRSSRLFNRVNALSNFSDSENEEINTVSSTEKKDEPCSFTEQITKRLLRHRPTSLSNNKLNTKKSYASRFLNDQPSSVVSQVTADPTSQLTDSITPNWVSYSVLIGVIIFFACIFSFYFYSRYLSANVTLGEEAELSALEKEFDFNIHDLNIPGCLKNNESICSTTQIRPALLIIKEMKKIVDQKLLNYYCKGAKADDNPFEYKVDYLRSQIEMSIGAKVVNMELESRPDRTKAVKPSDLFLSLFANALDLLKNNDSKWFIRPVGEGGKFDKIVIDQNYPKSLNSTCQIKLFVVKTLWYFVTLAVISLIGFVIVFYVKHLKSKEQKEKQLLFDLVEKSLELLQSPDEPKSLPVLHVRDTLLDPVQRKSSYYQKVWDGVVQFIETNESRVKSSLENIDGEDYKTWKWISNQPDTTTKSKFNWQANVYSEDDNSIITNRKSMSNATKQQQQLPNEKASRTINTSTPIKNNNSSNVITGTQLKNFVALTRFLKVRGMVNLDKKQINDDWKTSVSASIIEKCIDNSSDGKTHGLQHIYVDDRNEGLVYIKCDSIENASNAFKALHGCICDEESVTVKFLKEERYYSRFPDAKDYDSILETES